MTPPHAAAPSRPDPGDDVHDAIHGDARGMVWLSLALVFVAALAMRHFVSANTDVSWLLTAGERVLGGATLYRDVIETNPPMAVLAYLSGIVLARVLDVRPELVVDGLVFIAAMVALALSACILKGSVALRGVRGWPLAVLAFAVLTVLPVQQFGQREHIATMALLPWLAVAARRFAGESVAVWAVVVAGLGAGLAMTFKPHFAIGIFVAAVALAVSLRSWRVIVAPENIVAGGVVVAYAFGVAWLFPDFLTVVGPLVRDVYIPVGLSLGELAAKPAIPIWIALVLLSILAMRHGGGNHAAGIVLASSCGFAAAFVVQRKGWAYHSYPMIALALLAFGSVLAARRVTRAFAVAGGVLLVLAFAGAAVWFDSGFDARPLQERVARLTPHPAILAITAEPAIGHPMVRALGGTWVSRQQGLWVAGYLERMKRTGTRDPRKEMALNAHAAAERAMLIADIARTPPDVVLIDNLTGNWGAWLAAHPEVAARLGDYRRVDTLNGIDILQRVN